MFASVAFAQTSRPAASPGTHAAATDVKPESKLTRQQAKDLLGSVDSIMQFVSETTGLPPVEHLKRRLVSRDEVNRYLRASFAEDEGAQRLARSEIVLKKFGLLARDFDLEPFLLNLLTEQIAGFYDEKTRTVNLLDWVTPELQRPVLAHELTHALQDLKVGLAHWGSVEEHGLSRTVSEDNTRIGTDEVETARQAVAEGQATMVLVDWGLKDSGKSLLDAPEIGDRLRENVGAAGGAPLMARAPFLLQRTLDFPYTDGLNFEQALLRRGGTKLAFAGALAEPPRSTFEVLHPSAYLAHAPVPLLALPDVHGLLDPEWDPYDVGAMGELDVEIMATLFGGPEVARAMAPAWNGGVYYAAQRRSASAAEKHTSASLGVFYLSRWRTPQAAEAFAHIYDAELGRKYSGLAERKQDEAASGESVYTTAEGDVLLTRRGTMLFIAEGFPLGTARRLREEALAVQSSGPIKFAAVEELHQHVVPASLHLILRDSVLRDSVLHQSGLRDSGLHSTASHRPRPAQSYTSDQANAR